MRAVKITKGWVSSFRARVHISQSLLGNQRTETSLKSRGPEYTMRPISGSAEVSGVSCIHEDLCVVIYASFLTEDTTKAYISKAFSLVDSRLSEFLGENVQVLREDGNKNTVHT